jgi:NAD(P)-dependent dehydrogenase (short-subunit alcohol dehydrogenase family)
MYIQDKVIVIVGGASGLGLATARYMVHDKGARVALLDLDAEAGEAAVSELGGDSALFVRTDVGDEESVRVAIDVVVAKFGKVHVCVNSAAPLTRMSSVKVTEKCVELMARNAPDFGEERGVVINISPDTIDKDQTGVRAARALGEIGVRVNAIAPGLFLTPTTASLGEQVRLALLEQIGAPKRFGDMREFAHCCAFIIENAYLNAETIRLDAASHLRAG